MNLVTVDGNGQVYTWQNDINTLGSIKVLTVTAGVNSTPTNITATVTNGTLTLSWPQDHTGWRLQSNAVGIANSNFWFDYPGATQTNQVGIPIDSTKTNVFFRMVLP